MFDLAFTHSQLQRGNFVELNAFAAHTAAVHGATGLTAYKLALFGSGTLVLFVLRRRRESETGAWILATCYAGLMVWWLVYLKTIEICLNDPAIDSPPLAF